MINPNDTFISNNSFSNVEVSGSLINRSIKMNKFKSFILFKGLDKDFKEYELNLQNEPDKNISLEVEHSSSNHNFFNR